MQPMTGMNALSTNSTLTALQSNSVAALKPPASNATQEAFQSFVGETFFGMMLKALRSTSGDVAYFDGGQAEDMFRNQLDQTVSESLAKSHGDTIAAPMYHQFRNQLDVKI